MALGGFLAGLAESSSKWPGAIQQRMLFQQKAEERAQDVARQQQNDIIQRLGITAEYGDVGATRGYGGGLSPENKPLLGAFVTQAQQTRDANILQSDNDRFARDVKEIELNKVKRRGDGSPGAEGSYDKSNPETGDLEITDGPPQSPRINEVYPQLGKVLVNDPSEPNGFRWVDMDSEMKALFKQYATDDAHVVSINWDRMLFVMSDKTIVQVPEEDIEFAFNNLQKNINLKFVDFTTREDYRVAKKTEYYKATFSMVEDKEKRERLITQAEDAKKFADEVYKDQVDSLQIGAMNPEQALANANTRLFVYQMDSKEVQRLLELWEPQFNLYKYNYKLDAKLRGDLDIGRRLSQTARNIDALLKDPEVRKRVGALKGRVENFRIQITGGRNVPQAFLDFQFELDNMRDIVQRARSGAAIPAHEVSFYKALLGSNTNDWKYLKGRMATIIKYENRKAFATHTTAWTLFHKQNPSKEQQDQIRRDLLFDAGSMYLGDSDMPYGSDAQSGDYYLIKDG